MARLHKPDMPPKRAKKVRLGIYRTQILPNEHDTITISGDLISQHIRTVDTASD